MNSRAPQREALGGDYILAAPCATIPLNPRLFAHLVAGDMVSVFTPQNPIGAAWWAYFAGDELSEAFYFLIDASDLRDPQQWMRVPNGRQWLFVKNDPDARVPGESRCQTMQH